MKSPERKQISYVKAGVLIVDEVKPAIVKGTAVRFDFSKGKGMRPPMPLSKEVYHLSPHQYSPPEASKVAEHNRCSLQLESRLREAFHAPNETQSSPPLGQNLGKSAGFRV
jgi:hypothetical protein